MVYSVVNVRKLRENRLTTMNGHFRQPFTPDSRTSAGWQFLWCTKLNPCQRVLFAFAGPYRNVGELFVQLFRQLFNRKSLAREVPGQEHRRLIRFRFQTRMKVRFTRY